MFKLFFFFQFTILQNMSTLLVISSFFFTFLTRLPSFRHTPPSALFLCFLVLFSTFFLLINTYDNTTKKRNSRLLWLFDFTYLSVFSLLAPWLCVCLVLYFHENCHRFRISSKRFFRVKKVYFWGDEWSIITFSFVCLLGVTKNKTRNSICYSSLRIVFFPHCFSLCCI